MCKIISVTNRHLAVDFIKRIKEISSLGVPIILREKDLAEVEYFGLAKTVLEITDNVILHTYIDTARKLGHMKIHLPLPFLKKSDISGFEIVGVSIHSVDEALTAQSLGATYITAGHVFATDCKKGLPPRRLSFLKDVCSAVDIPVFAIGGITSLNAPDTISSGAHGICVMSSFMNTPSPKTLYNEYMNKMQISK